MSLKGHRALITGAGQGIGRACAEVFSEQGADLVLLDRNGETLEDVGKTVTGRGVKVTTRVVDLTDMEALARAIHEMSGTSLIDILVNNAGFDRPGTIAKIDREAFESVMRIHVTVPFLLIKALLPAMQEAGWGRIINVSSIYGAVAARAKWLIPRQRRR